MSGFEESYIGRWGVKLVLYPEWGEGDMKPFQGIKNNRVCDPRVARGAQPWAKLFNAFGVPDTERIGLQATKRFRRTRQRRPSAYKTQEDFGVQDTRLRRWC